jgi:hypothetical protein
LKTLRQAEGLQEQSLPSPTAVGVMELACFTELFLTLSVPLWASVRIIDSCKFRAKRLHGDFTPIKEETEA